MKPRIPDQFLPLLLTAALCYAGCHVVSPAGLAGEAQHLCTQPFGLLAVAEVVLAGLLVAGLVLTGLVRGVHYLVFRGSLRAVPERVPNKPDGQPIT
jgi:hypothetical protein